MTPTAEEKPRGSITKLYSNYLFHTLSIMVNKTIYVLS